MGSEQSKVSRLFNADIAACLILSAINLVVFWNVGQFGYVFDDYHYVTGNVHFNAGLSIKNILWALTTTHAGFYHPVTWLSLLGDAQLYGYFPGGYHWTNLLIHIANTLLLYFFLRGATDSILRSALVAALFAVHPLHVESVAWVSARKELLAAFFWMLTMGAYAAYSKHPGPKRYFLVMLCFTLGLMSKPMLVTLPFVLLLLDYWPLKRIDISSPGLSSILLKRILEKTPLLALSFLFSLLTIYTERQFGAFAVSIPFQERVINALNSYAAYLQKMIWPFDLAVFYPYVSHQGIWRIILSCILLLTVSVFVGWQWKKRPYLPVGWLWYLGTLVPAIGLIQVGFHAMADRYTYIPLIGIFVIFAWGMNDLLPAGSRPSRRRIAGLLCAVLLIPAMLCSWHQVQHWKDADSLFNHALLVTRNNHLAHNNLGVALKDEGQYQEAIDHFEEAVRIFPGYVIAYDNLGCVYILLGKPQEGIPYFRKALSLNPQYRRAQKNLACALLLTREYKEAMTLYRTVINIEPDDPELYNNLGVALTGQGEFEEAMQCFDMALKINPHYKDALNNRSAIGKRIKK